MTPAARLQAAIEILDAILDAVREGAAAADTVVARELAQRRYAGSGDRRAIRALVYRAIRAFGDPPPSGRLAFVALARLDSAQGDPALAEMFDGSPYGAAPIGPDEAGPVPSPLPGWLAERLSPEEGEALMARAPLDLRVNTAVTTEAEVRAALPQAVPIPGLPGALRIDPPEAIEGTAVVRNGWVEVQDAGSQLVVAACRAAPRMTVVDLCAGGGGKALGLAVAMRNEGRLIACDVDRRRLKALPERALRAQARIETRLLDGGNEWAGVGDLERQADVVLVDAPCSGTGTLRRNPDARWRLNPAGLARLVQVQQRVWALGAELVRPGGALVFAVCSVLAEEGQDNLEAFLRAYPGWRADPAIWASEPAISGQPTGLVAGLGRLLTPAHDGTDGFFIARVVRPEQDGGPQGPGE